MNIKNKKNSNSIIILIVIILFIIGIIWIFNRRDNSITNNKENPELISLCFDRTTFNENGLKDQAWLKLNILNNDKVNGEFHNLPAETDSKVGKFEGEINQNNQELEKVANVWWDSLAEGMNIQEELLIKFDENEATVGFGEMIDRGDGVYVYKDDSNLYYIDKMNKMDCDSLDEKLVVENYVRDNIQSIASNEAVLGGNWYAISTNINPSTDKGEVIYEDGHIQSQARFSYSFEKFTKQVEIKNFEVIK